MLGQYIEIVLYSSIIALGFAIRTVISGYKNGCFYFKPDTADLGEDNNYPKLLINYIKNIHGLESPAWYIQSIVAFFVILLTQRFGNYTTIWYEIFIQIGIAILFMIGTYQMPSYHFQRGVTGGTKEDYELDTIKVSETKLGKFSKWRRRLFNNKGRILAQWLGVVEIIVAVILLIMFNLK